LSPPYPGWVRAEIEQLLADKDYESALHLIEEWFEKHPEHPVLSFYAGCAHALMGNSHRALTYYRTAERRDTRNESIPHNLIPIYIELEFPTHALRTVKRYLKMAAWREEDEALVSPSLRMGLEEYLRETAERYNVSLEICEKVQFWNEEVQIAQQAGDWEAAIAAANKALAIRPGHAPALNNRATSFFHSGRLVPAIADAERVLTSDKNNVHALTNLVRFYYLQDDHARMRDYFTRVQALDLADWEEQFHPLAKLLEAYAAAATDEEIHAFLSEHAEQIPARGYYMLGAAAANLGRKKDALRAWKKVGDDDQGWKELSEDAHAALTAGRPGLGRASHFPYLQIHELVSAGAIEELVVMVKGDENGGAQQVQRRHPGLLAAMRWLLHYDEDAIPAIHMLVTLGSEAAWDELRTFALGQEGTDKERMEAAQQLYEKGQIAPEQPLRLWLSGQWREILLKQLTISDPLDGELPYSEEVVELLGQAGAALQYDDDPDTAEQLYQRALALDPECCPAYNNLALVAERRGDMQTMRARLEQCLQVDPEYAMARCNLAELLLREGQVEKAEELLKPIAERTHFTSFEMRAYQLAQVRIHIRQDRIEAAENILASLMELYPDDEDVTQLAKQLNLV